MSDIASDSGKVRLGVAITLLGSGLMMVSSFLPWLKQHSLVVSGWDIWTKYLHPGDNPFVIWNMFSRFSPFVTGLTTLLAGAAVAFVAMVVLFVPRVPLGSGLRVATWVRVVTVLAFIPAILAAVFNLMSTLFYRADSMQYGLIVLEAGFGAAAIGLNMAMGLFNSTATYGRGFRPTQIPDQYTVRVFVGGFASGKTADERAHVEIAAFLTAKGYRAGTIIDRQHSFWRLSYYEYTVQFSRQ
jgi:hypothetical protein